MSTTYDPVMTLAGVFGPTTPAAPNNPWLPDGAATETSPTGAITAFNSQYFALPGPAAVLAAMLGGTAMSFQQWAPGYDWNQPQEIVQVPIGTDATGKPGFVQLNAGEVATYFLANAPQSVMQQRLALEIYNAALEGRLTNVTLPAVDLSKWAPPAPAAPPADNVGGVGASIAGSSPVMFSVISPAGTDSPAVWAAYYAKLLADNGMTYTGPNGSNVRLVAFPPNIIGAVDAYFVTVPATS